MSNRLLNRVPNLNLVSMFAVSLVTLAACERQVAATAELNVSTDWLADHSSDSTLALIHVGSENVYDEGHIPGATYAGFSDFVVRRDSGSGLRNELPSPEYLRGWLESLGVSDDSRIIVYSDTEQVLFATRLLFTLDYLGLGDRVSLLDGGLVAWKAEDRPLSSETLAVVHGNLTPAPVRDLVVDSDWVADRLNRSGYALIDARSHDQYTGEEEPEGVRAGHVPGAGSLPLTELFDQFGKMRHESEIERLLHANGVARGDTVVGYCMTGVLGTGVTFAARTLGYEVRLYDGSWEEWGADEERPVVTGTGGPR